MTAQSQISDLPLEWLNPRGANGVSQRVEERGDSAANPGRQARVLNDAQFERVIRHIRANSNSPLSDEVKVLLSFFAGLRVGEIAKLTMDDVCDADGKVGRSIIIRAANSKNKKARSLPMHPRVRDALQRLRTAHPEIDFICFSNRRGVKRQSVTAVTFWFHTLYRQLGLEGCSSHSGRRTFITNLARVANQHNRSLRDVQFLAGHAHLGTTERYIDRAEDLSDLVGSLGGGRR